MKNLLTCSAALFLLCRAAVALGCTSWVIMPERSASGRMLLMKCRDQHIGKLTASVEVTNEVRWLCIGVDGGARFGLNECGVATTSNYGGAFSRKRPKPPKNCRGIIEAVSTEARDAASGAAFVRDCGRTGWRSKGGLYIVADAKRAFTAEIASGYGEMTEIPMGVYVISNSMHLGGYERFTLTPADTLCSHRRREAHAREELQKHRVGGKYTIAGVFKASRLTGRAVPFNRFSLSAVCFELDPEFPETVGCAYVALGPQQHTVYLPTPMALEQFPEDMRNGKWAARAFALRMKLGDDHRYLGRIEALEKVFIAEFGAAREEALTLLRSGRREEAKKLLNATFQRHYTQAKALLREIAEESGCAPDPAVQTREYEERLHKRLARKSAGRAKRKKLISDDENGNFE